MRRHTTACAYWNVHGQSGWIIRRQVLFATPAFVYTSALTDEALLEAVYCARAVLQLQARRLLRPDGLFLGAMLGGSTLQQLRRGGPPCPMRWLSRLCMLCMLPPPVLDTRHTPCTTTRPLLAEWWPTLNAKTNQAYDYALTCLRRNRAGWQCRLLSRSAMVVSAHAVHL